MSTTTVVTARISADLNEWLLKVASAYERPNNWVIARAIERYVKEEIDLLNALAEAEADIEAGHIFTQEQVEDMFNLRQGDRNAA